MTHPPRISRKQFAQTTGALAMGLAVTGTARAAGVTSIDIVVTHYPAQDYALPVVVAQQLGFMAKHGINVNSITGSEGGGTSVRNISQGGLFLGAVATPAAIKAIMSGEDLRIIGGAVQTPGTISWSTSKNSPIKTIHDFVGKNVGCTNPGSASEAMIKLCLMANKIDPSTVNVKAAGGIGENLTLLKTGGLDVAFTVDPVLTQHQAELKTIFFAREYVPSFMQTVWIAGTDALKNKSSLITHFMAAYAEAVDYTQSHPIDAATRYAHATNADPELIAICLGHERPASYFGKGQITQQAMSVVVESMRLGNLIGPNEKVQLAKIVDLSALPPSMRVNMNVAV